MKGRLDGSGVKGLAPREENDDVMLMWAFVKQKWRSEESKSIQYYSIRGRRLLKLHTFFFFSPKKHILYIFIIFIIGNNKPNKSNELNVFT